MLRCAHLPVPIWLLAHEKDQWTADVTKYAASWGNLWMFLSTQVPWVYRSPEDTLHQLCGVPQAEETFFPFLYSIGSLITYSQNTSFHVSTKICFAREFGWSWTCHPPSRWANVENTSQFFQNIPDPKICSVLFSRQITTREGRHQYFHFF